VSREQQYTLQLKERHFVTKTKFYKASPASHAQIETEWMTVSAH